MTQLNYCLMHPALGLLLGSHFGFLHTDVKTIRGKLCFGDLLLITKITDVPLCFGEELTFSLFLLMDRSGQEGGGEGRRG